MKVEEMINKKTYIYATFLCITIISCAHSDTPLEIKKNKKMCQRTSIEYYLGPGDEIEIIYHVIPKASKHEYVLAVGDVIEIEFYYHPDINRRVSILPDGTISLPLKGSVSAAGLTPSQIDQKITHIYSDTFKDPSVSITLVEYNQTINQLKNAITTASRGQSKLLTIRPDGYITFPLLDTDIKASGLTIPDLKSIVVENYNNIIDNLSVSLILKTSKSNMVYVMGEVENSDYFHMDGPTTLTQILSRAGGVLDTAEKSSILVISRNKEKEPVGKIVNLDTIFDELNIKNDLFLKQYDVVYVPKSKIANVNIFIEQYINKIIPNVFTYVLNSGYDW